MTAPIINGRFNLNTIVMSVCTFVILGVLAWVGRTSANTHDSVIRLESKYENVDKSIEDIKTNMITRNALSIELLKLQIPIPLEKERVKK